MNNLAKIATVGALFWTGTLTIVLGESLLMLREIAINSREGKKGSPYGASETVAQIIVIIGIMQIILSVIIGLTFLI